MHEGEAEEIAVTIAHWCLGCICIYFFFCAFQRKLGLQPLEDLIRSEASLPVLQQYKRP